MREPIGLLLALVCALSWAAGTVYMKWARIKGDLLAITFWQIVVGVVAFAVCYLVFEGVPKIEPLQWRTWAGILFNGIFGTGFAYFIWFNIIGRLSTAMASLGSLTNPVVGVIGAVIVLGDRPTTFDIDRLCIDLRRRRLRADAAAAERARRALSERKALGLAPCQKKLCGSTSTSSLSVPLALGARGEPLRADRPRDRSRAAISPAGGSDSARAPPRAALRPGRARAPARRAAPPPRLARIAFGGVLVGAGDQQARQPAERRIVRLLAQLDFGSSRTPRGPARSAPASPDAPAGASAASPMPRPSSRPARPTTWCSSWKVRSAARGSPLARPRSASTMPTRLSFGK